MLGELREDREGASRWLVLACLTKPLPSSVAQELIWSEIVDVAVNTCPSKRARKDWSDRPTMIPSS